MNSSNLLPCLRRIMFVVVYRRCLMKHVFYSADRVTDLLVQKQSSLQSVDRDGVKQEDWFTCAEKDQRTRRRTQMAGFLDNFRWPECECIDWGERRNAVASVVAGILVSRHNYYSVTVFVGVSNVRQNIKTSRQKQTNIHTNCSGARWVVFRDQEKTSVIFRTL